jgi:hypothetical protein
MPSLTAMLSRKFIGVEFSVRGIEVKFVSIVK